MGIPHYSRVIKGKAVAQGPEYGDRTRLGKGSGVEGDETEDLYRLLVDVMVRPLLHYSKPGRERKFWLLDLTDCVVRHITPKQRQSQQALSSAHTNVSE